MSSIAFLVRLTPNTKFLAQKCVNLNSVKSGKPAYLWQPRRGLFDKTTVKGPSDRTRLILLAGSAFALATVGGLKYDEWKDEKARKESIKSQLLWDSEQRKFKPSEYLSKKGGSKVPMDLIEAIPITRHVDGPTKLPGNIRLRLFQYQTCPFCCKVRAFLDYYGIPYDVIEVNPVLRQQVSFTEYKKVPMLIISKETETDDKKKSEEVISMIDDPMQLTESTLIISMLASYLTCNPGQKDTLNSISDLYQSMSYTRMEDNKHVQEIVNKYFLMKGDNIIEYKPEVKKLTEERRWREWADNVMVHTISPNIYRTMNESLNSFNYFSEVADWEKLFPWWERMLVIYAGATVMYFVGRRLKKRHVLKEDVRESLYDACRQWTKAIGKDRNFMGGNSPNLADLAVYGVMNSFEGCPAFSDALKETKFGDWYYAVKTQVKNHSGHRELSI
ncbi:Prostaglandin E synthase 2 [Halotydeus destructor]|nr:Prostaglandin E synthase 2 [Halotydeus destructor]